jgi:hypothetical protein
MDRTEYRKALNAATGEFERLLRERVELDGQIARLKQTIACLTGLCRRNGHSRRPLNGNVSLRRRFARLTIAIRQVLADAAAPLRPPELRDTLLDRGVMLDQYVNKLAGIHNTLARLQRQGEVTENDVGWTLTEKGRLASQMDLLDLKPGSPSEGQRSFQTGSIHKRSGRQNSSRIGPKQRK